MRNAAAIARAAADKIRSDLLTARTRAAGTLLELDLDCESDQCPIRQVRLHADESSQRLGAVLRCPACGRQLIARYVRTAEEANREHETWARAVVNRQLFIENARARLKDPHAIVAVPDYVLADTRLPCVERASA